MNQTPVTAVDTLDLSRYVGLWYEVGRLPMKYEDHDATDITAHYAINDDGSVEVDNRCLDGDGKPTQAVGRAELVEGEQAKLTVTFLPAFLRWIPFTKGDYWVLRIDRDYATALVGTPDHANLWLLSRSPQIDEATETEYLDEARRQGFELADWIRPLQRGHVVTDAQLAD